MFVLDTKEALIVLFASIQGLFKIYCNLHLKGNNSIPGRGRETRGTQIKVMKSQPSSGLGTIWNLWFAAK